MVPPLHVGPQVHADAAGDGDAATSHAATDPFDLPDVAADVQLVALCTLDRKKVVHAPLPLPQIDGKGPDLVVRQCRHHIGREHLCFKWNVGLLFEGQSNHARPMSRAGLDVRLLKAFDLHWIVVKRHRVDLLEQRPQVLLDLIVEGGLHEELPPVAHVAELSLFDHDVAAS